MEIKSAIILEVEKNERLYQFVVPVGAPYGEAVDTAYEVFVKLSELAQENIQKAKEAKEKADKEATETTENKNEGLEKEIN